jgi:hypothetical protein
MISAFHLRLLRAPYSIGGSLPPIIKHSSSLQDRTPNPPLLTTVPVSNFLNLLHHRRFSPILPTVLLHFYTLSLN